MDRKDCAPESIRSEGSLAARMDRPVIHPTCDIFLNVLLLVTVAGAAIFEWFWPLAGGDSYVTSPIVFASGVVSTVALLMFICTRNQSFVYSGIVAQWISLVTITQSATFRLNPMLSIGPLISCVWWITCFTVIFFANLRRSEPRPTGPHHHKKARSNAVLSLQFPSLRFHSKQPYLIDV